MEPAPPDAAAVRVICGCGSLLNFPLSHIGKPAACPSCKRTLTIVAHRDDPYVHEIHGQLVVQKGPHHVGEQIFLTGASPIEVGKLPGKDFLLVGELVSRNHCFLEPVGSAWAIEDNRSKNGTYVNGRRITRQELCNGDRIRIGDYDLTYHTVRAPEQAQPSLLQEPSDAPAPSAGAPGGPTPVGEGEVDDDGLYKTADLIEQLMPPRNKEPDTAKPPHDATRVRSAWDVPDTAPGPGPTCPCCGTQLPKGAKICVPCGIDVKTGRALITSEESNLDQIYIAAESIIRFISWVMPFGFSPIASEAFGTRKPYATRVIAGITVIVSAWFLVLLWTDSPQMRTMKNLMLWGGNAQPSARQIRYFYNYTPYGDSDAFRKLCEELEEVEPNLTEAQVLKEAHNALPPEQQYQGQYGWSQLITHALLHGGIMHLVGNLIFLFVFGSGVNALIGNVPTILLYPLFAIAAGLAQVASVAGESPLPMIGASGAVMGLAGLYLVLFPVHQVHMAVWYRHGLWLGMQLSLKLWPVRGFWVVLFYIAFDVFWTAMGVKTGTAHWAHLGGFGVGVATGLILLLTRLINARGGDLISVILGKAAWALVGRPNRPIGVLQRLP